MTKTFVTPRAASRAPLNSILAAATTARDLDIAHRKAAKANGFRHSSNRSPSGESGPILSARQSDESLMRFVLRVGRLVAVQIRERGKK